MYLAFQKLSSILFTLKKIADTEIYNGTTNANKQTMTSNELTTIPKSTLYLSKLQKTMEFLKGFFNSHWFLEKFH